jgi:uncharacterized membrane protein YfcA
MHTTILFIAALLVGLAKGGLGPLAAMIVPLVAMVMPVETATGIVLPMLMVGDIFALRAYWREWDMRHIRLLIPTAVIGVIVGALLLTTLPEVILRRILGIFTLLIAAYNLANETLESLTYTPHPWHGYLAGGATGFASALANAGAPLATAYLLLQKLRPVVFIGTSTLFFAIINLLKLPIYLVMDVLNFNELLDILIMLPLIPLGVWMGRQIIVRINQKAFEWIMLAFLVYLGISLLLG